MHPTMITRVKCKNLNDYLEASEAIVDKRSNKMINCYMSSCHGYCNLINLSWCLEPKYIS